MLQLDPLLAEGFTTPTLVPNLLNFRSHSVKRTLAIVETSEWDVILVGVVMSRVTLIY